MSNLNNNELMKYAYLLDQDNYCVENKIFIDLMWYITKNKENGIDKESCKEIPKGMFSTDKNGKMIMKYKSYVIRNAGIMFQQIFYWHFNAIKNGKTTKYQYKEQNVVKMDFEDWWNSIRLTDTEVTTANKFLTETGLIKIVKMRIKVRDQEIYKPSNCYIINIDVLEKYLSNIIEISKEIYSDKVEKVREQNIKTSIESALKKKESTDLLTDDGVTLVTQGTLNLEGLDGVEDNLSTLPTDEESENDSIDTSVTPVSGVTIVTPVTPVTIVTPVSGVTYISNTSCYSSCANTSGEKEPILSVSISWEDIIENLKNKLTPISLNTWFISSLAKVEIIDNEININTMNEFTASVLTDRYMDVMIGAIKELTAKEYNINIDFVIN